MLLLFGSSGPVVEKQRPHPDRFPASTTADTLPPGVGRYSRRSSYDDPPSEKNVASIRDIANRARVSIGTVDRVLHSRGRVSDSTRRRVQRIVSELGYKPNIYARNLSLAKTFRFVVVMPKLDQDSGYWRIPADGIERAHRQLGAARVRVLYCHFDRYSGTSFEKAFNKALRSDPDGILMAPILQERARQLVNTIPANLPYVFFDSTLPDSSPLTSIGQDPYQSGVLAAHLMSRMSCVNGVVALFKVIPEDFHISERLRGFRSTIAAIPSMRVTEYEADSHGGDAAFRAVARRVRTENKDLLGVFVSNAWTHPFARMFNGQGASERVCVIGYDLVAENRKCLEEGTIDFLISQRPVMQGFEGINALYRNVVLRDKVNKSVMVPLDIITKDNVRYYQD